MSRSALLEVRPGDAGYLEGNTDAVSPAGKTPTET